MKPSIIVEGYDGAGKSYLCGQLKAHYNLPIYRAGPPAKNNLHALDCCHQQMERIKQGAIMDRVTPISRLCYQQDLGSDHYWAMLRSLHEMTHYACIIWCRPPTHKHIRETHDTDEHILDITTRKHDILKQYDFIMSVFKNFKYVRTIHRLKDVTNYIDEQLDENT